MIFLAVNKLQFIILKTNFIGFNNIKTPEDIKIWNNNELHVVNRIYTNKFLKVFVDEKLGWRDHINHVRIKLSKNIAILNKIQIILRCSEKFILYTYFTLFHSLCGDLG